MDLAPAILRQLLTELGDWLDHEGCEPVEWVVCGGVAMTLQHLLVRATNDVDVLGEWDARGLRVLGIEAFPSTVQVCIDRVVRDHPELAGLGGKWINLGPGPLVEFGLPNGFEGRLVTAPFGERLTLHLLGRVDLIALKLYAASDELGARRRIHIADLTTLAPTYDELDAAVGWMRTLPDFPLRREETKHIIRELGHDGLDYYV